jgi:hypothetical protein
VEGSRPKTLAIWITWLLSVPGIISGVYVAIIWWWGRGKDLSWSTSQGRLGLGLWVWMVALLWLGFITILPATVSMLVLWGSKNATTHDKIGGLVVLICAWLGLFVLGFLQ